MPAIYGNETDREIELEGCPETPNERYPNKISPPYPCEGGEEAF